MVAAALNRDRRRSKAALFLILCGWAGAIPHWLEPGKSLIPAFTLAFLLGGYGLHTVLSQRKVLPKLLENGQWAESNNKDWPNVDILVAARDEETVLERLVEQLKALSYSKNKLKIWIINDGSQDKTSIILDNLAEQSEDLNIIHRSRNAGGGKSGALNTALKKTQGEWLLILDADAQLEKNVLQRIIPIAVDGGWAGLQLRKAVVNGNHNLLTKLQSMEMAMDAVIQQGRLATNGVVELRGNGQLLKKSELERCGGFNEETVTDDLDLSFRLLSNRGLISILWDPPIGEEAVDNFYALWKQRQRWAEGGLQRFFDYWPVLISRKLSRFQKQDLAAFFLLQYALPVVSFADLITTILTKTIPTYWPLSIVAFSVSGLAFWKGCQNKTEGPDLPSPNLTNLLMAILYLGHWFIVIPWVTIKMSIFPKKLMWIKTVHKGKLLN